jgi:gluconolactonase
MKVDQEGNVYSGGPGPALLIINPAGKCLGRIMTPNEKNVVNMAFGDTDRKSLYLGCVDTIYRLRLNIPGVIVGPISMPVYLG